ncbi:unnamed protein product [Kuraishia capsulata CBS 1993]|uniref:Autophagy-related protein 16 domain-containing protein n=1 Tax=Kuraishia capsulata CBS 1993 TaxID=1382522 RepID=W6MV45_9ASCO|nr:uncharacterized protein KUCA_T00002036001 [Kuraishia capsulata CBS 1993]CDK26065.1 unnamed protein product [Kuraishia capsulata CBS 1993]
MDWRSQLLDGLKARDDRINAFNAKDIPNVIQSFNRMTEVIQMQESELSLFNTSSVHQDLKSKSEENQKLKSENSRLKSQNTSLSRDLQRARVSNSEKSKRLDLMTEENQLKFKNFEVINDEILSLQIENNVLNERNKSLAEENEKLVKRWLDKVGKDAQFLNELNAKSDETREQIQ